MAWCYEVIADESGKRYRNQLVFATQAEAKASSENLMDRWALVTEVYLVETDAPANYRWDVTMPYPASLIRLEKQEVNERA
jgi:hypothetical protein